MKIKTNNLVIKFKLFIARMLGVKQGPYLIPVRDFYLFVDVYQQIWRLTPTHDHRSPVVITLLER